MTSKKAYAIVHAENTIPRMATSLRVSDATRARAAALAHEAGTSIGELVDRALDTYESKQFWSQTKKALAVRRPADPDGWDAVDRDGLEDE